MRTFRMAALALFFVVGGFAVTAWASPPSDIILDFNKDTGMLKVKLLHHTMNEKAHFIKTVTVWVGDKEVESKSFDRQTGKEAQETMFTLTGVKAGDKISVEGQCNIQGSKKVEMTVE